MQKRGMILVLAALVALSLAAPVMAAGGGRVQTRSQGNGGGYGALPGKPLFALVGTIAGKGTDWITVEVVGGNRLVEPYFGETLTILVTSSSFRQWTSEGCVPIEFGDVAVGDSVSVQGTVVDDDFVANRVTVDVPLSCCQP